MKRFLVILTLILSTAVVFAQNDQQKSRKEKKAEEEAILVEQTQKLIDDKTWTFKAEHMFPSSGASQTLTYDYTMVFQNNFVNCDLPYFGRAYQADYASSDSPLSFSSAATDYSISTDKKNDVVINFTAKNKSDEIKFILTVFKDGSASLSVMSTNRQSISFTGNLIPVEKNEN